MRQGSPAVLSSEALLLGLVAAGIGECERGDLNPNRRLKLLRNFARDVAPYCGVLRELAPWGQAKPPGRPSKGTH
jgi:hypothetical protein